MGHLVIFNTWGLISTFGVFQTHYTSTAASSPGLEPSAVAWIGSTQMLLHFSLGLFSGRALDAGHFHWAVVPGVLLAPLGMFLTSLCTSYTYWQLFLAQGVLTGVGCGLQFSPCISLVATYFARNRSVALAIVSTGSATGGLVYPTVARQLLPRIGFAWTVRCMAFMMLGVGALYAALLRPRLPPRKSGPVVEVAALRELPYALFLLGVFLMGLGQFFAFYYIGTYAIEVVGVSYGTSVNLLLLMNGVGVVGRLVPAYVADRWCGPFNTVVPSGFAAGVLLYAWTGVRTLGGLYAFSVVYGICIAGFMGMFPVALTSLTKDLQKVGVRNGMGFGIIGLGSLIGPPIAGALIQRNGHGDGDAGTRYVSAQVWGASMVIAGSAVLLAARITITGEVGEKEQLSSMRWDE
ncbi:major facilitator superfamily domain-containing protein [Massariosphaeria phaeospora]|uniref:Major facilitator superfamily domain-containing protein n=1 Tax=Massariosphaeria phaeospora TaxID=100035 RepID=A0A7C8MBC1_9PLEO|nr:major facilitator superfamily domain-containing protein [Massariosphaeria phaeospora]